MSWLKGFGHVSSQIPDGPSMITAPDPSPSQPWAMTDEVPAAGHEPQDGAAPTFGHRPTGPVQVSDSSIGEENITDVARLWTMVRQ